MVLIHRPFKFLNEFGPSQDLVLAEFCENFLKPPLTPNVKAYFIPFFKERADPAYYDKLIRYVNSTYYLAHSTTLFYCILALEPVEYGECFDCFKLCYCLYGIFRAKLW